MKRIFILVLFVIACQISFGQVYQLMPQYGYQALRMSFDSTLQIPTVCGVPTLKSVYNTRRGAIAFDSCNNRFYTYNPKTFTWSYLGSGGGSTSTGINGLSGTTEIGLGGSLSDAITYIESSTGNESIAWGASSPFYEYLISSQNISLLGFSATADTGTYKPLVIDPITHHISNLEYYPTSSGNGGSTQNGRFGNDTATVVMAKIHNNSGTTLTNGKVVFLATSGTNSDAPSVRLANNKHDSTSANTFGFVTGTIASNDTGYVILSGLIEKLNTSAFSNGDIIYLDSVSGNWTKSKPVAPYHMVYLGVVVKANAGNGSIFVKCQNGYELTEIHDCQINNPLNNQIIVYSDTQKVWKNRNIYSVVDTSNVIATKTNLASKLNISDTSVFDRKSVAAFTFKANNTASTANATDQVFRDSGTLTYSGTITWTGTTAPSGATNHRYRWCQIGKQVTITFSINYATAGSALTAVKLTLPVGCPAPTNFGTLTAANDVLGSAWAFLGIATSNATTSRVTLNNNASNNGYEFNITAASANYKVAGFTLTYFTD